jgi:hypothetical protein
MHHHYAFTSFTSILFTSDPQLDRHSTFRRSLYSESQALPSVVGEKTSRAYRPVRHKTGNCMELQQSRGSSTSIIRISTFRDQHFKIIVSIFRDLFRRIGTKPRDWRVGFPHSSATAQITLSSVKPCISLNENDYCRGLWNKTLLRSL